MAKRILVPLDRSDVAEAVLPVVADLARSTGATIRLLHVAPIAENLVGGDGRLIAYSDQEMERLEAEGLDHLRAASARVGLPAECVVRFGDAADEIVREADAFHADLVAMTTTGKTGLRRALLGSVAEQVSGRAHIPVLLYRARVIPE